MGDPANPRIVADLLQPAAYPESCVQVDCIETHISWVFLTDHHAYKLKKPVRLDFLDFSTPERRRAACEDELRLNRRLAPDVYLSVEPITRDDQGHRVGGHGPVVDWVVKMRRLSESHCLLAILPQLGRKAQPMLQLAERLASFYRGLTPVPVKGSEYRARLTQHVRDNREALLKSSSELPPYAVQRLHGAQLQMLALEPELFDARVRAQRIVEGHGDLRPEHVYFTPDPVVIDCVEFSEELRQLDLLDELSFLEMECDFHQAPRIGRRIARGVAELTGDDAPSRLRYFYKSYRACVRAKVAAIRVTQEAPQKRSAALAQVLRYTELGELYHRRLFVPLLVVVHGLMGSGKSTLARALAQHLGAEYQSTDDLRKALYGHDTAAASYGQGHYAPARRQQVYEAMARQARQWLEARLAVVLDGSFIRSEQRALVVQMAGELEVEPLFLFCDCPPGVAMARIDRRAREGNTSSDARSEFYHQQRAEWQQSQEDGPRLRHTSKVSSERSPEATFAAALGALRAHRQRIR